MGRILATLKGTLPTLVLIAFARPATGDVVTMQHGSYEIRSGGSAVEIPFEMFGKNIRMKVMVDGHEARFLLDQGSLWDPLFFFGSPRVDGFGLAISGEEILGDPEAENPIVADKADNVEVDFGGIVFRGQPAIVSRYVEGLPNPWEGADGQISAAFFKYFAVRIDWDQLVLTLTETTRFRYAGEGQVLEMKPGPDDSRLLAAEVELEAGRPLDLDLLVDLGGIWPLYLPVGSRADIEPPADAVATRLGRGGFGAPEMGHVGRIASVRLGELRLNDVETAFVPTEPGAGVYGNTMIGLPLLQRFNLLFDYPNERLILEPRRGEMKGESEP